MPSFDFCITVLQVEGVGKQLALGAEALAGATGRGTGGSAPAADQHEANGSALCSGEAMEADPMIVKQEQI